MTANIFCSQCGEKLLSGAKFCPNCGAVVNSAQPQFREAGASHANWQEASDEALKKAYAHRRRFTKEEYAAIFTEFERRGLKPQLSWGWIIFWLILCWPVGLILICNRTPKGKKVGMVILKVFLVLVGVSLIFQLILLIAGKHPAQRDRYGHSTTTEASDTAQRDDSFNRSTRRLFASQSTANARSEGMNVTFSVEGANDDTLIVKYRNSDYRAKRDALGLLSDANTAVDLKSIGFKKLIVTDGAGETSTKNL